MTRHHALYLKIHIFWNMTLCRSVNNYLLLEEPAAYIFKVIHTQHQWRQHLTQKNIIMSNVHWFVLWINNLVKMYKKTVSNSSRYLDDWLTVHRSITLVDFQLDA